MKKNKEDFYFFWDGFCSQWFQKDMEIDEKVYDCCEQYMMAMKAKLFHDDEKLSRIMEASNDPRLQKKLGRQVKGFNLEVWEKNAKDIVYAANWAKFSQHKNLRKSLLSTGDKVIVEASPYDKVWGVAMKANDPDILDPDKWRGTNWLGEVLMKVRDDLKKENPDEVEAIGDNKCWR